MTDRQSTVVPETTPHATRPIAQERWLGTSEDSLMLAIASCAYKTLLVANKRGEHRKELVTMDRHAIKYSELFMVDTRCRLYGLSL